MLKKLTKFSAVNQNFFFIDSTDENLNSVETHLYGYCIEGENIIDGKNSTKFPAAETVDGSFVFVEKSGDKITIKQDYIGTYGLFLFRSGNYFALSNSFMMLVDNVKTQFQLSLNDDFINHIFIGGKNQMGSLSFTDTLVNEIELLPRVCKVVIDIPAKTLDLISLNYEEYTVPIDSPEAMKILDDWVLQYTGIIKNLYRGGGGYIQCDLSGGTDTRNVLPLFLISGIDLDKVNFLTINNAYTNEWGKGVLAEDFKIASEIAAHYNFSINKAAYPDERRALSVEEAMHNSFYTKLGFHTPMYVQPNYFVKPVYRFAGSGGEIIRGYGYDWTVEGFVNQARQFTTVDFGPSMKRILLKSLDKISATYGIDRNNTSALMSSLYRETRVRNHYGMGMVELYLANKFMIAPLADHNLSKIQILNERNSSVQLLYAVILTRYQKELLNFKVQGGRTYNKAAVELAQEINSKYPVNPAINLYQRQPAAESRTQIFDCQERTTYPEGDEYFLKILNAEKFKAEFTSYFPEEVYYRTKKIADDSLGYPLMTWYPLLAAAKTLHDVKVSREVNQSSVAQIFTSSAHSDTFIDAQSNKISKILNQFQTASIYLLKNNMRNFEDFPVTVFEDNIQFSPLFNPERTRLLGYSLESFKQSLRLRFTCKTEGAIAIYLGCKDIFANNEKLPLSVDYTYLAVNEKVIVNKRVAAQGNKPFVCNFAANAGAVYEVKIRWQAHNYSDGEFLNLLERITNSNAIYN